MTVNFDPATGGVNYRSRISSGKEQRMKSYQYEADFILRERRNAPENSTIPPGEWPVTNTKYVNYPASRGTTVVTTPYMLVLLAAQLQAQGPNHSMEVIVNTDINFYRVKLTSRGRLQSDRQGGRQRQIRDAGSGNHRQPGREAGG